MRILHIGKYFPPVKGGMERFLGDLVAAQRRDGNDTAVLVHSDGGAVPSDDPGWLMRCPLWLKLIFAPISPLFPLWLWRAVRAQKPQVIHIHMPNLSAFWALVLPSARATPWVVHWHSDVEVSRRTVRLAYPYYRIFERALLERAEFIIATSQQYLDASMALRPWRHKCHVIPLGVDPRRLPDLQPGDFQGLWMTDRLRVLGAGRLTYYKGFDTLIKAATANSDIEVVIVGEGEERPRLEKIIRDTQADVRLLGEVGDHELARLMASCDVFCLPSRERTEAFGIVLMEAMRYGKPLLVSDLLGSGVNWVARNGQNAMAIPVGDAGAWAAALATLARSPAKRQLLGHLGQERYAREFNIAAIADRVAEVYDLTLRVRSQDIAPRLATVVSRQNFLQEGIHASPRGLPDRLLVVIPALNEAADICDVIRQVRAHAGIDVLVIDDGSTDDTVAIAMLSGAKVLRAPLWQGAWGAIQTGIRYALRHGYSGVVTMDADGQHEPMYLPELLTAARDADVVIAACPSRGSRLRHLAWAYFRFLTGFDFDDLTSGFRYYNSRACRLLATEEATLLDYQDVGVLLLLHHAHFQIAEIPVAMNPRRHGASRVFSSWWTVIVYMAETSLLCLARWNYNAQRPADLRELGK